MDVSGDVFRGFGVEIELDHRDDFLKVCETLTRIGIPSLKDRKLTQICHILHKRQRYAILSYKELYQLDGKDIKIDADDIARRNTVAMLLDEWGLARVVDPEAIKGARAPMSDIKVLLFKEKNEWELSPNYKFSRRRVEGTVDRWGPHA